MRAVRYMVGSAAMSVLALAVAGLSAMAATPALTLSPASGPPGVTATVKGSGYGATGAVDVYFDSADMVVPSTTESGAFSVSLKSPGYTQVGIHWITAAGRRSGLSAQKRFNRSVTACSKRRG